MLRKFLFFLILWGVAILGCASETLSKNIPPTFVETAKVQFSTINDEIYATGTLLSVPGITIKSEIAGRVQNICFNSGDSVKAGDRLVEINAEITRAKFAAAKAKFNLSELNLARAKSLYSSKDISKADFDQIKAAYDADLADLNGLRVTLEQATIVAPFSGKLGLNEVSLGDYISVGQNIVNLQTLDPLKVDFSIPETYLSKVNIGQNVSLKSDIYPNKVFEGKVEATESLINSNNRTLTIRANIPNPEGLLIPGGFVAVTLKLGQRRAMLIPQIAIVHDVEGDYVFKMSGTKADKVKITIGIRDESNVEIKSGLKENDIIVVTGQMKIFPGVKIIDASGTKA